MGFVANFTFISGKVQYFSGNWCLSVVHTQHKSIHRKVISNNFDTTSY